MLSRNVSRRSFALSATAASAMMATTRYSAAQGSTENVIPKVVTTFSIVADWTQNVAGDLLTVVNLVPAGADAHTFDPSPEQIAEITDADLIFQIGLGFESWLDSMIESSGTGAQRIDVSDDVPFLEFIDTEGEEHEDHDEHGDIDPHIWGDVQNAIIAVKNISDVLSNTDPANATIYETNAENYIAELELLDESIRTDTATIPEEQRKLVTTHDTFGYYAAAYDFEIVGTALGSISTGGGDPSAQYIAELVSDIQSAGVPAIFAENVSSNSIMESIADESGVEVAPPLYTDALGGPDSDGSTYVDMMAANTRIIVDALA